MRALLLFPIHLFSHVEVCKEYDRIYLIEEPRYFTDFRFHKLKLAYHRASMKHYASILQKRGYKVKYIEFHEVNSSFYSSLFKKYDTVCAYDPNDHALEAKIKKVTLLSSRNFCITRDEASSQLETYYNAKSQKFNFMNFYKMMRQKLDILMTRDGKPQGGVWSFDKENRKPYPRSGGPPIPDLPTSSRASIPFIQEAIVYVEKHFPKNDGSLEHFIYPITHEDARSWCEEFCKRRFKYFGVYEDAILKPREEEKSRSEFLFHSVLSPMMNIGLITDNEVLEIVKKYEKKVPMSAYEGFIRQVIGWRNYVYAIYATKYGNPTMSNSAYEKMIKKMNFMKHTTPLPYKHFWSGTTQIAPVDDAIHTIQKYAYVHHIQRLMVLGNVMFLLRIHPQDVFRIFMEWTIDAYEWVMMANVYGMSQHADGGKMMTRPYFSSSHYIRSMSDYACKDSEWCRVWDALYGTFIQKHRTFLKRGYASARMVTFYERKSEEERKEDAKIASSYQKILKKK